MKYKNTIYYVLESTGWVQHKRVEYFRQLIPDTRFRVISVKNFLRLWSIGLMRKSHFYFASWRSLHPILKAKPNLFKPSDYERFMTSVTSHMNIGGGLDPQKAVAWRTPQDAKELAVALLKKYKIVTVNSTALHELLCGDVDRLYYCPNGVDTELYNPVGRKSYDKNDITIGWAGKIRISKNYETIEEAFKQLREIGYKIDIVLVQKDMKKAPLDNIEMAQYYKTIDYYLCASWNEGTPNPGLEAAASGVVVVSTRVGNMRELIKEGETGYFVDPTVESIVSLFKKIHDTKKEDYDRMSANIRREICANWTWTAQIENYKRAFNELLKRDLLYQ